MENLGYSSNWRWVAARNPGTFENRHTNPKAKTGRRDKLRNFWNARKNPNGMVEHTVKGDFPAEKPQHTVKLTIGRDNERKHMRGVTRKPSKRLSVATAKPTASPVQGFRYVRNRDGDIEMVPIFND